MAATIDDIPATVRLRTLIVESSPTEESPILLFLHGKGEASLYINELPKVGFHLSPPFRAAMGTLRNVIVVAPQAPHSPDDAWNWRSYAEAIGQFIRAKFPEHVRRRMILATGFSRGGLGVLQIMAAHPDLVTRWAIVDPQRAEDDTEGQAIMPAQPDRGWLRYGNGIPKNMPFSEKLAKALPPENCGYVDMGHGDLAVAAFAGNPLGGQSGLYQFLGLNYNEAGGV